MARLYSLVTNSRSGATPFPASLFSATLLVATLLVATLLAASLFGAPLAAQSQKATAKAQLEFGVEMAQRGLWSEALFRFKQANRIDPENPSVYNNLAVAHEALGLFDEALTLYRKGLELSPQDKGLRNNYARFLDFYRRFRPEEEDDKEGGESPSEDVTAEASDPSAPPPPTDNSGGELEGRNFYARVRVASATSVH